MFKLRTALLGLALLPLASLAPAADEKPVTPAAATADGKPAEIPPPPPTTRRILQRQRTSPAGGAISLALACRERRACRQTEKGIRQNEFLKSTHSFGDFRLVVKMKLVPNGANSGIQFHSIQFQGNEMSGPQADAGHGWWGSLYGENFHNKTLCPNKAGEEKSVNKEDWNVYEIVAVGTKVRHRDERTPVRRHRSSRYAHGGNVRPANPRRRTDGSAVQGF